MRNELFVELVCPDGLSESLGFTMPKELPDFVKWYKTFSEESGYKIKLSTKTLHQILGELNG